MAEERFEKKMEENISVHIFNTSAQLIGVCLTVIGVFTVLSRIKNIDTMADELVALNSGIFVASCALAYFAMRTKKAGVRYRLERAADFVFLVGLFVMALIGALITIIVI